MNKTFIVLTIICLIGSLFYKKWATNRALEELYALKIKDKDEYIKALDSYYIKFTFSEFNRNLMKLNYWIDERNEEKIHEVLNSISKIKLSEKDRAALYTKMFGYYIDKKEYDKAKKMADSLLPLIENKKDEQSVLLVGETKQIVEIYCNKNTALIEDLEETLETIDNQDVKSILAYRIARLYYVKKDFDNVKKYIELAIKYSNNAKTISDLNKILKDYTLLE